MRFQRSWKRFSGSLFRCGAAATRARDSAACSSAARSTGASAGCTFKNPELCGAGKLIDDLALKGRSVGKAVVSDVHANFIVNQGGATAREVAPNNLEEGGDLVRRGEAGRAQRYRTSRPLGCGMRRDERG